MIRKAKRQLHAVREDVVKKQLHAVREEVRHKHHHRGDAKAGHRAGSEAGLKFSDIDPEGKSKSHWMDEFEDDGDVSHLLSSNQSYHASSTPPLSKKKPVQPNLAATTNSASVFDDLFVEDDLFEDSHGGPLLASSQISAIQQPPHATSSQQKEASASLFEDGPGLSDAAKSLESDSKHNNSHEFSGSGEYEELFSEGPLPVPAPKHESLFKDQSPKQALGFLSSGEYDNLFSDSLSSSSPVSHKEGSGECIIADKVLSSSQDSEELSPGVNGTSSGCEVVVAAVSYVTHHSGDEAIVKKQGEVLSEASTKECEDATEVWRSEELESTDVQFSEEKLLESEVMSTKPDGTVECGGTLQLQEHMEEASGVTVVSVEVPGGPLLASVAVSPEDLECPSTSVSEEDKGFDKSMEFLSHVEESSKSASPLPPLQAEPEKQPAQEVSEAECNGLIIVSPSDPNDQQPIPYYPSSSFGVAVKLPHNSVEPTLVALSDASEHPLLGIGDPGDVPDRWSLPSSSLTQISPSSDNPRSCTTALEITEDFYSQSPATVRKEVPTKKTAVEETPRLNSSTSSSSQSHNSLQSKLKKKSTTGKLVPVVPPRPPCLSSSPKLGRKAEVGKRQDSDTVSITSQTSVISTDSVFLRDTPSVTVQNVSSGIPASNTSHSGAFPTDSDKVVSVNNATSDTTGDAPDIGNVSQSEKHSAEVTVASEEEESGEFDYTLLILTLAVFGLYLHYALNPFVYLAGFLSGFLIFYLTVGAAFVLYVQHSEREAQRRKEAGRNISSSLNSDELPSCVGVDLENYRTLEGKLMSIVFHYHPNTHHPSKRIPARVMLHNDFMLDVRYRRMVRTRDDRLEAKEVFKRYDLRDCSVLIVPEEVAQNRKRRWSKKFPICISDNERFSKVHIYLFVFTSRDKEEWFRRMRHASSGKTYDELTKMTNEFNSYMSKYMPKRGLANSRPIHPATRSSSRRAGQRQAYSSSSFSVQQELQQQQQQTSATVSFSTSSASEKVVRSDSSVSIKSTDRRHESTGNPVTSQLDWINAGMARLVWDVWREEHWRRWVTSRIQRKLVRIKTPSFMEPLTVTDVCMGNDMPTIKGSFRPPEVNQRGVWVYLVVEYRGEFTMTINTKLKLSAFEKLYYSSNTSTNGSESPTQELAHHSSRRASKATQNKAASAASNPDEAEDEISSGSDDEGHSVDGSSVDSSSLEESIHQEEVVAKDAQPESPLESPPSPQASLSSPPLNKPAAVHVGRKQRILNSMVSKLQHMAVKSKMIQKAAEKVSKQPMVLTVRVRSLDGYLAVNMAPPPSDTLWFGFVKNPHLILDAKPKVGQREVTLSYVTDWIEKKLCEVVEKKLVLPNMEDLVIPILTSGLPEDMNSKLLSPS